MSTDSRLRSARDAKGREVGGEAETETETETEAVTEAKAKTAAIVEEREEKVAVVRDDGNELKLCKMFA